MIRPNEAAIKSKATNKAIPRPPGRGRLIKSGMTN